MTGKNKGWPLQNDTAQKVDTSTFSFPVASYANKIATTLQKNERCRMLDTFLLRLFCGRRGIRTPGSVKINGFQDRRNRPLCHPSIVSEPFRPALVCPVAERRGFEPLKHFWRLLTFQASQFNHSCTFPFRVDKGSIKIRKNQQKLLQATWGQKRVDCYWAVDSSKVCSKVCYSAETVTAIGS